MIALYDHIQELRAELRSCYMTRRERAAVQAELARAVAEQAELDRAFDRALEARQNPAEAIGAAA
jgi:septal ring factor EnvC (AmiA/AmiB activator)